MSDPDIKFHISKSLLLLAFAIWESSFRLVLPVISANYFEFVAHVVNFPVFALHPGKHMSAGAS